MSFKVDWSKFKKISSDKSHTVMKHADGHEMRIAHEALTPKMRSHLAKIPTHMADGGEVTQSKDDQKGEWVEKGSVPDKRKQVADSMKKAFHFAEGGEVKKDKKKDIEIEKLDKPVYKDRDPIDFEPIVPKKAKYPVDYEPLENATDYNEGGKIPPLDFTDTSQQMAQPQAPQQPQLQPPAPQPEAMQQPASSLMAPAPGPQAEMAQGPDTMGGYQKQVSGIEAQSQAESQQGMDQAKAMTQQLGAVNKMMTDYQSHFNDLDNERKAFQQDIVDKHIDAGRYMGSMDAGQKFDTAVGLILGGLGGGGSSNSALDFLNKQIDRDIASQQAELGKRETLLSANMRQFGNLKDATEMTKVMQNDMLIAKLKQAEAKATSPLAKARAQQEIGKLEMQVAPMVQQLATRKMLDQVNQSGQASNLDPAKLIPSVVPEKEQASAFKELQEAQNMSTAKHNILDAFSKVADLNTVSNRLTSPLQSKRQIDAIKQPIVASLSKATAGRFTEQDAAMLDTLFPSAGDNAGTIAQKKQQIDRLVSEKMNFPVLNAYGLDPHKFQSTSGDSAAKLSPQQQSFAEWAKANPTDPRAKLVLKKLGL